MSEARIAITAEPVSNTKCRFVVERPFYPESAYFFGSSEQAEASPLAKRLFAISGVSSVLVSHDTVTVTQNGQHDWRAVGGQVGAAIREHIASGEQAVGESVKQSLPAADVIKERVQQVLDSEINPSVASHGGVIRLIDVKDNTVFIQMGGGCQGCGMADVTLKGGIEVAIRAAVPEVGDILDTTDHAAGRNPYFTPTTK